MSKNKSEQDLRIELDHKKRKEFLDECNSVLTPVFDKYLMRLVPTVVNLSNEYKVHYEAAFAVQKFTKEEVTVQKGNETLDTQPETNTGTNSNNKVSKK